MAKSVLAEDPVAKLVNDIAGTPKTGHSRAAIEGISAKTRVPANFLMAFSELTPGNDDDNKSRVAEAVAAKIAPRMAAGEKIEDIVRSLAGDEEQAKTFIERAYQISDDIYADRKPETKDEPGMVGDLGRSFGGSFVKALGGGVEAAGMAAEELATRGRYLEEPTAVRAAAKVAGDAVRGFGEGIREGMSEDAKQAVAGSSPDGNIFDPSTWSAGDNPSLKGYSLLAADVLGSFLPVVATAVLTRSPTATAAVGGLQGGGAGMETARQVIIDAANTTAPDGRSMLETQSPYYRDLLKSGKSPEEALAITVAASERLAFLMTSPVSAFGGAATAKLIAPGAGLLASQGAMTRILGTATLSSLEEGVQEASETIATRFGINAASGMDLDLTTGTFGDFILGALGGGIPGAMAGAVPKAGTPPPPQDEPAPPGVQPPGIAPSASAQVPPAPAPEPAPAAPTPRPRKPMGDALAAAPVPIVPDAGGAAVTVRAADLPPFVGKIVRDNGVLITVRDETGEEMQVSLAQIESGEATIEVASPEAAPPVQEEPAPTTTDALLDPALKPEPGSLSQQAMAKITQPDKAPKAPESPLTPEEAMKRARFLEEQASIKGWNKRMLAKHAELMRIAESHLPPSQRTAPPPDPDVDDAAAEAVREAGYYDGPWNDPQTTDSAAGLAASQADTVAAPPDSEQTSTPLVATGEAATPKTDQVAHDNILALKGPKDRNLSRFILRGNDKDGWTADIDYEIQGFAGGGVGAGPDTLPSREDAIRAAADRLKRQVQDIADGKAGSSASPRHIAEAKKIIAWADKMAGKSGTTRGGEGDGEKNPPPSAAVPPSSRPTGKTYRLDASLTPDHKRALAKARDTEAGNVLGEIDAVARRAEAAMRAQGKDIDNYDDRGARKDKDKAPAVPDTFTRRPAPEIKQAEGMAVQGDLLGAAPKTEAEIAFVERRKAEWGKFLAIAQAGSSTWDGDLEAAAVRVNKSAVTLTGPKGSRTTDTDGMNRQDIIGWARWAMTQIGGFAEHKVAAMEVPDADAVKAAAKEADRNPTEAQKAAGNYQMGHVPWNGLDITIETAKGDMRAGFSGLMPAVPDGHVRLFRGDTKATKKLPEWIEQGLAQSGAKDVQGRWFTPSLAIGMWYVNDAGSGGHLLYVDVPDTIYQSSRVSDNPAAIRFSRDPDNENLIPREYADQAKPTPAQPWAVTLPAHYGYIKRTEGADGDHLDVYIGDNPESDEVFIFDQYDPKTGKFDEHKTVLGTTSLRHATAIYDAGFSDGSGPKRRRGPLLLTVDELKSWLQRHDTSKPATHTTGDEVKPKPKPKAEATSETTSELPAIVLAGFDDDMRITKQAKLDAARSGRNDKMAVADANIRRLRMNRFRAELAAAKDIAAGEYENFVEFSADFPRAGAALKAMFLEKGKPAAPKEPDMATQNGAYEIAATDGSMFLKELARGKPAVVADTGMGIEKDGRQFALFFYNQKNSERKWTNRHRVGGFDKKTEAMEAAQRLLRGLANPSIRDEIFLLTTHVADRPVYEVENGLLAEAEAIAHAQAGGVIKVGKSLIWLEGHPPHRGRMTVGVNHKSPKWGGGTMGKTSIDFTPDGSVAGYVRPRDILDTIKEALRDNDMRAEPEATPEQPAPDAETNKTEIVEPKASKEAAPAPAKSALSGLSQAKQDRAALLRARIAERQRNQLNSGLDPELLKDAVELVGIYIEAGVRRFGQMLNQVATDMGLKAKDIEPWARAAYNQARDNMELDDQDVSDMDDSKAVLAEVKALRAEASNSPETSAILGDEETGNDVETPELPGSRQVGEDGERETAVRAGIADGDGPARPLGEAKAGSVQGDDDAGRPAGTGTSGRGPDSPDGNGPDLVGDGNDRRPVAGAGGIRDARPARDKPARHGRPNYRINDPEALFAGGPKARFAKNKAAIEAYQSVTDENREPTPEELDAMASYIGWGSFGQDLFQGSWLMRRPKPGWEKEDAWLRDHLGKEAWESAQNSIINAHYTDPPTVKAMWDMVSRMGFKGGRILEPAMGVGNFFGMMPADIEANSELTGIELDTMTGGIAKMLYPQANVRIMGYEKSKTPDDFYDLIIGNWPFANFSPSDRRYNDLSPSLHDYFFLKAIDQVRPGGIVIGITSAFTMDGEKNKRIRMELAKKADLVDVFRLPSGAFDKYAGTSVVTDIIILKKREAVNPEASQANWVNTATVDTPAGTPVRVNQTFATYPQNVLGVINFGSGSTYGKPSMIVDRPADLADMLDKLPLRIPEGIYAPRSRKNEPKYVANNTEDRTYSVTIGKDGSLYHVRGDQMAPLESVMKGTSGQKDKAKVIEEIRGLVELRRTAGAVMDADRDGATDADTKRAALKAAYTAFRKKHGAIAKTRGINVLRKLKDPFVGSLLALETRDGAPAPIMERAIVRAPKRLDKPTIRDAFVIARNESVTLDLARIAELSGASAEEVAGELVKAKAIYRTPGGGYQAADTYLSGNVRVKLRAALDALEQGEDMQGSVDALTAAVPEDIPYFNIQARFGADWIPSEVAELFLRESLGLASGSEGVSLIRAASGWRVEVPKGVDRMRGISDITGAPLPGTKGTGLSLKRFLEATLNTQSITVTAQDKDGTFKDTKATEMANQKSEELRNKFGEWIWADPERRVEMEGTYNETMNAIATPVTDGSFLEFPGMALQRGDDPFSLRKHQIDAIWRGIMNQRGIYGHEVGTGKTITMTGIAVESRRYGLAKKPLLIAHNANSASVAAEAQATYPGAKIMYVDNLSPNEIDAQLNRMRTDDWDLIVIPHSLIDRMALTEETLMQMAAEDIAEYEREAIEAALESEGIVLTVADMDGDPAKLAKLLFKSPTAKEMVKARNRIIEMVRKQAERSSREGAVSFEDLGVDMILVDESHEFKKPPVATRMTVKGLNKGTSNRSLALRFLTNYVKTQRGGTGVHVFTGTPITNTLTEVFHQMYYAMDDVMRQAKVHTWDGFFKTFANTISDVEVTSTNEYENVDRLAAFINVSELRRMAGQFLDIVFADDMPEFKPRTTASGKTMKSKDLTDEERVELRDGRHDNPQGRPYKKIVHDIGPMSYTQKAILAEVVRHAQAFKSAGGKARREIMLKGGPDAPIVFNAVPNRASMDARLHDMTAPDDPQSKANRAVANIARIYKTERMSTQVLFMDEGYSDEATRTKTDRDGNKTVTKVAKFNLVADIVDKLVAEGIKREEIAVVAGGVTAEQKLKVQEAMNSREIRVVIGQTKTLGVGVNMQKYLRAIHHIDAPWMPGDLEQRNGRGHRQGNTWNTVFEYRYLTEGLDGRRWQVLAIKDRFIKAFLKAKSGLRTIEGDAADDTAEMDGNSLSDTLSEAAGDPRLMIQNKMKKKVERLKRRERIFVQGVADAISKARRLRADEAKAIPHIAAIKVDATHVEKIRDVRSFAVTVKGKTYTERQDATPVVNAALDDATKAAPRGQETLLPIEVNDFAVKYRRNVYGEGGNFTIIRKDSYHFGTPSLASIEMAIRNVPDELAYQSKRIAEIAEQAARLEKQGTETFQQAEDLAKAEAQVEEIENDLKANPVAPPSWLRTGAPVDTLVYVDDQERVVTGHRWTSEGWFVKTDEGDVPYTDVTDDTGVAIYEPREFEAPVVGEGSKLKTGEEDGTTPDAQPDAEMVETPRDARISYLTGWDVVEAAPPITDTALAAIASNASEVMAQHGLAGKVPVEVVRVLLRDGTTDPIQGRFRRREGRISVSATASQPAISVLHHEIIHALRDAALWGKPFGLFTAGEWDALSRAARANKAIMARVRVLYPDMADAPLTEEAIAELYRGYAKGVEVGRVARVLAKIRDFASAMASAMRGSGFNSAAGTMRRIAEGDVGRRGPAPRPFSEVVAEEQKLMREMPDFGPARTEAEIDKRERGIIGHLLTNAMNGKAGINVLALVPGRALFSELGGKIASARTYLSLKERMDAMRNDWHAKTDETAQAWRHLLSKDGAANARMMELMHDATIAGVDPSKPFVPRSDNLMKSAREAVSRHGDDAPDWALSMLDTEARKKAQHAQLSTRFADLPAEFQSMFGTVRDRFDDLGTAFENTVLDNARKAMSIGLKRAEQRYADALQEIADDGLAGETRDAAEAEALEKLEVARKMAGWNKTARLSALRARFESNRLDGPYFPLARHGQFFLTVRDADGKVISFSRFENEKAQATEAKRQADENPGTDIQIGVLSDANALREQVDPGFVADIEEMLGDTIDDPKIMDMVWQRWLETLPDMSVRRSRLHRKGTKGYDTDAFRAFGKQMFHGSHQLARLTYAMDMQQALEEARREAANATDPNRAGLIVNEMERRHEFIMNPTGSAWAQAATSGAFIYYLAVTPAAALVNVSQTSVVGIPILAAGFRNANVGSAAVALTRAMRDFVGGRGALLRSKTISPDENSALKAAYERGVIDKTQSHDLAGVSESGVEYSDLRVKWMARISYLFHHAERMNREVTFLAAYRMARDNNFDHQGAITKAADLTWKTHFDYQNTARPRLMQNDAAKVLLTFRNFQINMLWRLFRDSHQMLAGASKDERAEARAQLAGISLSMMMHAGVTGTWGYGIVMMLLGLFADDDDDDPKEWLQTAMVETLGPQMAGLILKGIPGHLTGVNLSQRIGMPDLWFRSSDRTLEDQDVYSYWLEEAVGPVPGIVENLVGGTLKITDGEVQRGFETMFPKAIRDIMQAYRYYSEGVTTYTGNPIIDDVGAADALKKALGFTPARVAEAYESNTRLRNRENRIEEERSRVLAEAATAAMNGALPQKTIDRIAEFNAANPDYPIKGDSIRKSIRSRSHGANQTVGGIRLNAKLDARLREEAAPKIYN